MGKRKVICRQISWSMKRIYVNPPPTPPGRGDLVQNKSSRHIYLTFPSWEGLGVGQIKKVVTLRIAQCDNPCIYVKTDNKMRDRCRTIFCPTILWCCFYLPLQARRVPVQFLLQLHCWRTHRLRRSYDGTQN